MNFYFALYYLYNLAFSLNLADFSKIFLKFMVNSSTLTEIYFEEDLNFVFIRRVRHVM